MSGENDGGTLRATVEQLWQLYLSALAAPEVDTAGLERPPRQQLCVTLAICLLACHRLRLPLTAADLVRAVSAHRYNRSSSYKDLCCAFLKQFPAVDQSNCEHSLPYISANTFCLPPALQGKVKNIKIPPAARGFLM